MEEISNKNFQIFNQEVQHSPSFKLEVDSPYVVKDFLQIGENSILYGEPGLGKTAIIAAIAAHAAIGRDFGDSLTDKSAVIYFAAEDKNGVHKRAFPYLHREEFANAPFYVVPTGFDMLNASNIRQVTHLIEQIKTAHGLSQALVVFDTLNRMLGQSDENSSTVIGSYLTNAEHIAISTNASCLTIHHSGKGQTSGARGSSAIVSNADNVFKLTRSKDDKNLIHIVPEKTKDIEEAKTMSFKIEPFIIGVDKDGAKKSVPKATPQGATEGIIVQENKGKKSPPAQSSRRTEEIKNILLDETNIGKKQPLTAPQVAERTSEAFRDIRHNRDSLLKAVKRVLAVLVRDGFAEEIDGKHILSKKQVTEFSNLRP